jgi:hypothetical protein
MIFAATGAPFWMFQMPFLAQAARGANARTLLLLAVDGWKQD